MFTLRVEWQRRGQTEYSMHQCSEYQVQIEAASGHTIVAMDGNTPAPRELILESGQIVYVMNEAGKTVDTIRQKRSAKNG